MQINHTDTDVTLPISVIYINMIGKDSLQLLQSTVKKIFSTCVKKIALYQNIIH